MTSHGHGYIVLDYLVTALLWLAVLVQVAVIRDRSIAETRYAEACRCLVAAGLGGIALRFSFVLHDVGDVRLPPFSLVSLALLCLGVIGQALDQLMRAPRKRRLTDIMPPAGGVPR